MLKKILCLLILTAVASTISAQAITRYVVLGNPGAAPPYNTLETAASNIRDAVDAANLHDEGDTVLIANGHYVLDGEINIANCLVMSAENDPAQVMIDGGYPAVEERCFSLDHPDAFLSGLTITNGYAANTSGGGVYVADGTVSNCVIADNCAVPPSSNGTGGGGVCIVKGLLTDCVISNNTVSNTFNSTYSGGGGILLRHAVVSNCTVVGNKTKATDSLEVSGSGGGIFLYRPTSKGIITGCLIKDNEANVTNSGGGGVYYYWQAADNHLGLIERCQIINNKSLIYDGGGIYIRGNGLIRNCLILGNEAYRTGGGISLSPIGNASITVQNCTVISNAAVTQRGGGIYIGGSAVRNISNCIIYYNTGKSPDQNLYAASGAVGYNSVWYSCTPKHSLLEIDGIVTNSPEFINQELGDYRLLPGSACINQGLIDADWMTEPDAVDLDGFSRIDRFSGLVDIGCYEFIPAGILFRMR